MDRRPLTWALVLLGPALAIALGPAAAQEAPEKLCGHHFVRALVRLCGGPRWSSEEDGRPVAGGDREWGRARTVRWGFWGRVGVQVSADGFACMFWLPALACGSLWGGAPAWQGNQCEAR